MPRDEQLDAAWEKTLASLPDASDLRQNQHHLDRSKELFEAGWYAHVAQEAEKP